MLSLAQMAAGAAEKINFKFKKENKKIENNTK
jgi:hypothetical protein